MLGSSNDFLPFIPDRIVSFTRDSTGERFETSYAWHGNEVYRAGGGWRCVETLPDEGAARDRAIDLGRAQVIAAIRGE